MGKYLFYDIDGTLMGPSRKVTEKTKWAIERFYVLEGHQHPSQMI